jgi:cAMP-dependent protein kinase regulator
MDIVIGAMDERRVKAGDCVIVQGESGNELYVVEEGILDCFKHFVNSETNYPSKVWRNKAETFEDL